MLIIVFIHEVIYNINVPQFITSLFFMANIIALACSAAFPTIGNRMTLIKAIGRFSASEAP